MTKRDNVPFAKVSEDARFTGRVSIDKQFSKLQEERAQLSAEKKAIELQLSDLEEWKREEIKLTLSKRLARTRSIEETNRTELEYRKRKRTLVEKLRNIEVRFAETKHRLGQCHKKDRQGRNDERARQDALHEELLASSHRIENLLRQLLEAMK